MNDYEKTALEIYFLLKENNGAFSSISGYLKRKDSSKISRQLNPTDDRRDNPFTEVLEILEAISSFAPGLEEGIWQILERERNKHRKSVPRTIQLAELISKIFPELGDVVLCNSTNASQEDMEREAFQLLKAVEAVYEQVKNQR